MGETYKDPSWTECLSLMKNDIGEAIAADELLYVIGCHVNNWNDPPKKLESGLQFMVEALALRMALAVNRLFQPAREDRANFAQLRKLGVGSTGAAVLDDALNKAATLGKSLDLTRLKACRDGFIAHTLRGSSGSRDGIQTPLLCNALENAEQIFEVIHKELTGNGANLTDFRNKWRLRAAEFWRGRLPIQSQ